MDKDIFVRLGVSNAIRQKDDYYATDPKALEIFLDKLDQDGFQLHDSIWECACGEGHLSEILKQRGYKVLSTDIVERGYEDFTQDFLQSKYWDGDILTNPPYTLAKEFVEKAYEITQDGAYIIMFLKVQFLEGQARKQLFEKYPLKFIYVNSKRQLCARNGDFKKYAKTGTAICYCWYIWEKGYKGETTVRWI